MRSDGRTGREKDRQSHRHDESNSRFSQFCERSYKRETFKKLLEMYNILQNEQELPLSINFSVFP
jgi:hypothetical protein